VPRDVLAVFTGVSGSGKSSLAFGTNQECVEVATNEALVNTALTLPPLQVTDALDAE
jgi:excinuclease UvrABC ATPase subunit